MQVTTYNLEGSVLDRFDLTSGKPTETTSRIAVDTSASVVAPGEQFTIDLFIENIADLDKASCTLEYYKDEPPALLTVGDAQPTVEGVQIEEGPLGGIVTTNNADNNNGVITYQIEQIGGLSSPRVKVASVHFDVPADEPITAFYLVPKFILYDTVGKEIPHFMGGAKVTIKK